VLNRCLDEDAATACTGPSRGEAGTFDSGENAPKLGAVLGPFVTPPFDDAGGLLWGDVVAPQVSTAPAASPLRDGGRVSSGGKAPNPALDSPFRPLELGGRA
jgi:hypothetical protein